LIESVVLAAPWCGETVMRNAACLKVKGLSGSQESIELTPNEYRNMERYRDSYRVCIVSDALKRPSVHIFSYSPDHRQWEDSDIRVLRVQRITSARMFV